MGENHSGHIPDKHKNMDQSGEPEVRFTGGPGGWTVNMNGEPVTGRLATAADIIVGDLNASVQYGKHSRLFDTADPVVNSIHIRGAAETIAQFPTGSRAAKNILPSGATRIVPVLHRK